MAFTLFDPGFTAHIKRRGGHPEDPHVEDGVFLMACNWLWASATDFGVHHFTDGQLTQVQMRGLAPGVSRKVFDAMLEHLIKVGSIEGHSGGRYYVHDWEKHQRSSGRVKATVELSRATSKTHWETHREEILARRHRRQSDVASDASDSRQTHVRPASDCTSDAASDMRARASVSASVSASSPASASSKLPEEATAGTPNRPSDAAPTKRAAGLLPSAGFDRFWTSYPKKVGKGAALRAWTAKHCEPIAARIVDALTRQNGWLLRDGGKYVPNPATWLNEGRWDDEPPGAPVSKARALWNEAEEESHGEP